MKGEFGNGFYFFVAALVKARFCWVGLPRCDQRGYMALLFFAGEFLCVHQRAFRTDVQLLADVPVKIINQIVRLLAGGIDQHQGAVKIFDQLFVAQFRSLRQQSVIKPFGFLFVAFDVEQNESFADFDVLGFIRAELPNDHHAAKHEQQQKAESKSIAAKESHCFTVGTPRCGVRSAQRADPTFQIHFI